MIVVLCRMPGYLYKYSQLFFNFSSTNFPLLLAVSYKLKYLILSKIPSDAIIELSCRISFCIRNTNTKLYNEKRKL